MNPRRRKTDKITYWIRELAATYAVFAWICLITANLVVGALAWGAFQTAAEARAAQRSAQVRSDELLREEQIRSDINTCIEIQKLYSGEREDAIRTYRNLNRNLRILKLERTPEIIRIAKEDRDRRLKKFAERPCTREAILKRNTIVPYDPKPHGG